MRCARDLDFSSLASRRHLLASPSPSLVVSRRLLFLAVPYRRYPATRWPFLIFFSSNFGNSGVGGGDRGAIGTAEKPERE